MSTNPHVRQNKCLRQYGLHHMGPRISPLNSYEPSLGESHRFGPSLPFFFGKLRYCGGCAVRLHTGRSLVRATMEMSQPTERSFAQNGKSRATMVNAYKLRFPRARSFLASYLSSSRQPQTADEEISQGSTEIKIAGSRTCTGGVQVHLH